MNTFRRFAVLCLFAAIGVGVAICIGMSANLPPKESPASVSDQPEESASSKRVAARVVSAMPETTLPPSAMLAEPHPLVAQQAPEPVPLSPPLPSPSSPPLTPPSPAPPLPGNGLVPGALNFLRKQLAAPPAAAAEPLPQPAKAKTTVNGEGDGKLRIHIYDEDIRKVLDLLSEQGGLNILASKSVEGKVSATLNGVDINSALQAILKSTGYVSRRDGSFIFVGTPEDFNNAEQAMDRVGTRVYRTNYVTAAELKALVAPLLTEKTGVVSVSSPAEAGIPTSDSIAGGDKFSGNEVLVVRDYEAVLSQIDQMVAEVDVRPLQVSIEAMILSVQLVDGDKFGVNFQLLRQNPNISFGLGSPPVSVSATDFPLNGGLKFGFLDTNLGAFLNALESVGDTNVIANPRLMVLNKQRAEIQIGEKKGYINQTITQTASSQSVEFLDTGTQLRLRPFISSDGLIRMEVHPELSDGDVKLVGGFTLPNKTLTQVTTNVMVRDGCTVVIGGLIKEQLTTTTSQVPVLGNLPFVGFAFRQTEEATERREVIVLLTPRIVYEPGSCQEGEKASCEYLRRQSTYADKMSPFGKRSIGRRYLRLAENAYAAGDQKKALWLVEMAVQFDPQSRAALDLRSNIWLGKPQDAVSPNVSQVGVPLINSMDGPAMPDSIADALENSPEGLPVQIHPLDRGTPGSSHDLVRPRKLQ